GSRAAISLEAEAATFPPQVLARRAARHYVARLLSDVGCSRPSPRISRCLPPKHARGLFHSFSIQAHNPLAQRGPASSTRIRPLGAAITLALLAAGWHSSTAHAQARSKPKRAARQETRREQAPPRLLSDSALAQLKYRYVGPVGNRVSPVA